MPIKRTLKRALVCLSLLFYLLVGFGSAFGAVLCLAGGETCLKSGEKSAACCTAPCQEPTHCTLKQESCNSCTELLRAETAVKSRIRPLRTPAAPSLAPLPPHLSPLCAHPNNHPPRCAILVEPPPSTILAQLRTVVLLR